MFLHSGASLHGHEFSKRATLAAAPVNLRKPLLRSTWSAPVSSTSILATGAPPSQNHEILPGLKGSTTCPEFVDQTLNNALVVSGELMNDQLRLSPETMSGDEESVVSDTDVSGVSSSLRQKRRSGVQKSTTYVLAHPPPKVRTKQRIIHMRPNLVLQIQQVTPGLRPKPTIDVYPSFAGARSIMAPLLRSVSGIAGIKRELSGQDIMLVRSEDYASQNLRSESENDEDSIMGRDLLAVLSPSKTEDKAEIIMAEGMVWVATTRSGGNSFSYEFTSITPMGTTITARWVRKQIVSSSMPGTPTSPSQKSMKSQFSDIKFTFSFLEPGCRRHPILATLSSTSLNIPDTYTTVTQTPGRGSPEAQSPSLPNSPSRGDQGQTERRTKSLEEWQKSFISVSAVWVALRHSWAPEFRPEDFMPSRTSAAPQVEGSLQGRRRSLSASTDSAPPSPYTEGMGRRKHSLSIRQHVLRSTSDVPKRATSTGAAFIKKRRAMLAENDNVQPANDEHDRIAKLNRRALSGDWNIGLPRSVRENSLAESIIDTARVPNSEADRRSPALAPSPMPVKRRTVSAYSPLSSLTPDNSEFDVVDLSGTCINAAYQDDAGEVSSKLKHRRWRSMATWFRKLSGR
ncbi:hypothetical protein RRF57_001782 [Xylaria bambusicola]|uniref:Uncharacterized protein n=1 Tax=Xylaria bambusicola TaxID=326684 RepID=A0AAN7UEB3_9PEZI